ncbi:MAG: hypothetical protein M3X11_10570 [Acidobacteriota bacterium]|nr:hypothetical protein [Acidobacteriota bacterium]
MNLIKIGIVGETFTAEPAIDSAGIKGLLQALQNLMAGITIWLDPTAFNRDLAARARQNKGCGITTAAF